MQLCAVVVEQRQGSSYPALVLLWVTVTGCQQAGGDRSVSELCNGKASRRFGHVASCPLAVSVFVVSAAVLKGHCCCIDLVATHACADTACTLCVLFCCIKAIMAAAAAGCLLESLCASCSA